MFCCYSVQLERGAVSTCRITVKEENVAMKGTVPTKKCELSPMVMFPHLNSCFGLFFFFSDEEVNLPNLNRMSP